MLWTNIPQGVISEDLKCYVKNTGTITSAMSVHCLDFLKCEQPTVVPDSSFTLNTFCICKRADTCMCTETLPPVTHPSFTEITDCTLQLQKDIILRLLQYLEKDSYSITLNVFKYLFPQWVHSSWARVWTASVFLSSHYTVHLVCLILISAGLTIMQNNLVFSFVCFLFFSFLFWFGFFYILNLIHENCVLQLKPEIHKL